MLQNQKSKVKNQKPPVGRHVQKHELPCFRGAKVRIKTYLLRNINSSAGCKPEV